MKQMFSKELIDIMDPGTVLMVCSLWPKPYQLELFINLHMRLCAGVLTKAETIFYHLCKDLDLFLRGKNQRSYCELLLLVCSATFPRILLGLLYICNTCTSFAVQTTFLSLTIFCIQQIIKLMELVAIFLANKNAKFTGGPKSIIPWDKNDY